MSKVQGETTLGENIADTGGLSIAIDAYKKWLKRKIAKDGKVEAQLPGIPLSPDQAMFVAYGQVSKPYILSNLASLANSYRGNNA